MIRRLAVDFDETITQIAGMLDEIEAEGPNLQRVQMRLELAETYVSIGDHGAARAQIQAAEQDSWAAAGRRRTSTTSAAASSIGLRTPRRRARRPASSQRRSLPN
jgi:hypothetical protein